LPPPLVQRSLFGTAGSGIDRRFRALERIDLGQGAWVDVHQHWLQGHQVVFESL
jgi:hypothetical protein